MSTVCDLRAQTKQAGKGDRPFLLPFPLRDSVSALSMVQPLAAPALEENKRTVLAYPP